MKNFSGIVIRGQAIGNHFGIATANLAVQPKPDLKEGVYIIECIIDQKKYSAIMHFGERKTFGEDFSIEVHVLNIHKNLYEKNIAITPLKYLREIKKFKNADQLYTQIEQDIRATQKFFLRQEIKEAWKNVSAEKKEKLAQRLLIHLEKNKEFQKAKNIGIYAALPEYEIPFAPNLEGQYPDKNFYYPLCNPKTKQLTFHNTFFKDLLKNNYNILEPKAISSKPYSPLDLIIVPSLALDANGNRLGQGAGYYDRFLKTFSGHTLSFVPNFAFKASIPTEAHDKPIKEAIALSL